MASKAAAVAAAVVTEIDTLAISGLTATQAWLHEFQLDATAVFRVTVACESLDLRRMDRGNLGYGWRVALIFSKRLTAVDNDTVDPLIESVEQVAASFANEHKLTGLSDVWSEGSAVADPLYDVDLLSEQQLFAAVVAVDVMQRASG